MKRPQPGTLRDGDCSKHTMKACVCHTAGERKEVIGDANEKGRCFVTPLKAECSHRKGKETRWIPQLHSYVNSCHGLEGSIKASGGKHRVDLVLGVRGQDPDLWLYW